MTQSTTTMARVIELRARRPSWRPPRTPRRRSDLVRVELHAVNLALIALDHRRRALEHELLVAEAAEARA